MKTAKPKVTPAVLQITQALKRASAQARKRAKAYGTEKLIAPLPHATALKLGTRA
jgi:hypothetical protein